MHPAPVGHRIVVHHLREERVALPSIFPNFQTPLPFHTGTGVLAGVLSPANIAGYLVGNAAHPSLFSTVVGILVVALLFFVLERRRLHR